VVEGCSVRGDCGRRKDRDRQGIIIHGQRGDGRRKSGRLHREENVFNTRIRKRSSEAISKIVHKSVTVEEAMKELKGR